MHLLLQCRDFAWHGQRCFLKVILVDAVFIVELIFRNVNGCWESDDFLIKDQMIFIMCDSVLLENQIPFCP